MLPNVDKQLNHILDSLRGNTLQNKIAELAAKPTEDYPFTLPKLKLEKG